MVFGRNKAATALKALQNNLNTSKAVCEALETLIQETDDANDDKPGLLVIRKGGIKTVVAAMKIHPDNEQVQRLSCELLAVLLNFYDGKKREKDEGALEALLTTLQRHDQYTYGTINAAATALDVALQESPAGCIDVVFQANAVDILMESCKDSWDDTLAWHCGRILQAIVEFHPDQAVPRIVKHLRENPGDDAVFYAGCWALAEGAYTENLEVSILVPLLLQYIGNYQAHAMFVPVLDLLNKLTCHEDSVSQTVADNAVGPLVAIFERSDELTQTKALSILGRLSVLNENVAQRIMTDEFLRAMVEALDQDIIGNDFLATFKCAMPRIGLPQVNMLKVIQLMRTKTNDKSTQIVCLWALLKSTKASSENRDEAAHQGAISATVKASRLFPKVILLQQAAIYVMGYLSIDNTKNQRMLLDEGGIDAMVKALRVNRDDEQEPPAEVADPVIYTLDILQKSKDKDVQRAAHLAMSRGLGGYCCAKLFDCAWKDLIEIFKDLKELFSSEQSDNQAAPITLRLAH